MGSRSDFHRKNSELSFQHSPKIAKTVGELSFGKMLLTFLLCVGLGVIFWYWCTGIGRNLPPGPRPLPLIGTLYYTRHVKKRHQAFDKLKEDFGDIVTLYFGPMRCILLNSAEVAREAFLKDSLTFAGRQKLSFSDVLFDGSKDILAAPNHDEKQRLQRKIGLNSLRKYASGEALEKLVENAFEIINKQFQQNPVFHPMQLGFWASFNIMAPMCFDQQLKTDDPVFAKIMDVQVQLEEALNTPYGFLYFMPFMKYLPTKLMSVAQNYRDVLHSILDVSVKEHLENYDPDKLDDFTYNLIHTWKEVQKKDGTTQLDLENFTLILMDMLFAGTETTRTTISWISQYLAAFPDVQERAQREIDTVLGFDGKVTAKSREALPYVDAIIHEVMRMRPPVPQGVARQTTAATRLRGYDIPANTMVMLNIWSIQHNEKEWPNHNAFLPERWLDDEGRYMFQQQGFMPFSIGRRSCIGESLAKLELHMIVTKLLQKYTLKPEKGKTIDLGFVDGFIQRAPHQNVVAISRG